MATYTPPAQFTNVTDQPSVATFNPSQANDFLTNFNDLAVNYTTNVNTDEEQANNLIQAYQYLSDPANQATEDAENGAGWSQAMLTELQADITEQVNLANYYGGNATPQDVGNLETQVGNVGNLTGITLPSQSQLQNIINAYANVGAGENQVAVSSFGVNSNQTVEQYVNSLVSAIQNSSSPMANTAANAAAGTTAQGYQLGATPGNIAQHLNGSANWDATANWIYAYIQTAQQGYNQLQQLQTTQENQQNAILQDFTLGQAPVTAQTNELAQYYGVDQNGNPIAGDTGGQVQIAQGQAGQDIYQQAAQQRQQINQAAVTGGASSSGERTLALGNVTAQASNDAAQIYQQDADAAEQAINNYNQELQTQNAQTQSEENSIIGSGLDNLMSSSTQAAIASDEQNQNATNEQNLTNNENAINTAKQNSSLWNNIATDVGEGVGAVAGTVVSRI